MTTSPGRCPNPDCEDSLGGTYQPAQFKEIETNVWECRQCGHVRDFR